MEVSISNRSKCENHQRNDSVDSPHIESPLIDRIGLLPYLIVISPIFTKQEITMGIIKKVQKANPGRCVGNIERRMLKNMEEVGEAAEAVLGATSPNNYKNKTWADVREELVDSLILNLDILLTPMPDQPPKMTNEDRIEMVHELLDEKLEKWANQRKKQKVADDS